MASNDFLLGLSLQSGKDAVAANPQWLIPVRSTDIKPNREIAQMEQTGQGRDGGKRFVTLISASGNFEIYAFPEIMPLINFGVLGANATTTALAPAADRHRATPASDQPYFTLWRFFQSDGLFEKFHNCKFISANYTGTAGQLVTVAVGVQGLKSERLAAQPTGGTLLDSDPFRVPGAVYNRAAVVDDAIREWNLNITAAQEAIQTTKLFHSHIKPGMRNVEFNFTQVFNNLDLYNEVLFGSTTGTQVSEVLKETDVTLLFGNKTNGPGLELLLPRLQYLMAPLDPSAGGEPLMLQVTGAAVPPASGTNAGLAVVADTYNQIESYPAAATV